MKAINIGNLQMTIIIRNIGLYGLLTCESMLRMFNGKGEKNDLKAARKTLTSFLGPIL